MLPGHAEFRGASLCQLSPQQNTNVFNLFESVSRSFKATVLNGRCEVLDKASPTRLIRIALALFGRRTAWDSAGFVQWRSALAYPRRLSPKSGQRLALSLARLARWSATTSLNTLLRPQRHGHAAKARQKARLRRLGIVSRCKRSTVAKQPGFRSWAAIFSPHFCRVATVAFRFLRER